MFGSCDGVARYLFSISDSEISLSEDQRMRHETCLRPYGKQMSLFVPETSAAIPIAILREEGVKGRRGGERHVPSSTTTSISLGLEPSLKGGRGAMQDCKKPPAEI